MIKIYLCAIFYMFTLNINAASMPYDGLAIYGASFLKTQISPLNMQLLPDQISHNQHANRLSTLHSNNKIFEILNIPRSIIETDSNFNPGLNLNLEETIDVYADNIDKLKELAHEYEWASEYDFNYDFTNNKPYTIINYLSMFCVTTVTVLVNWHNEHLEFLNERNQRPQRNRRQHRQNKKQEGRKPTYPNKQKPGTTTKARNENRTNLQHRACAGAPYSLYEAKNATKKN